MNCPFCGADDIELVSPWGGQLITSQLRCRACNTHFEAVREDFAPAAETVAADDRGDARAGSGPQP